MSSQSSGIMRLRQRRLALARAHANPDWRWRRAQALPEESDDWSASDAFDLAESLAATIDAQSGNGGGDA